MCLDAPRFSRQRWGRNAVSSRKEGLQVQRRPLVGRDGSILDSLTIGTPALTLPNAIRSSLVVRASRTAGGVFICTDISWKGAPAASQCSWPLNVCINLTAPWYRAISSFGPDPGATCFSYSQDSCDEAEWEFTAPGDATGGLGTSNPWNDQITNFMCQ
ncbi:hypothetical protein GGX14DRAFT_407821 [Mycena pura]|uniref:Uncharacterized protein n=1 Tax=Mycena pura TaxID=153505 RepID=A0AAD6UQH7_9AGAR|nr:hypothetical protein GGX14DRAFT_407821 [Mycena pura]